MSKSTLGKLMKATILRLFSFQSNWIVNILMLVWPYMIWDHAHTKFPKLQIVMRVIQIETSRNPQLLVTLTICHGSISPGNFIVLILAIVWKDGLSVDMKYSFSMKQKFILYWGKKKPLYLFYTICIHVVILMLTCKIQELKCDPVIPWLMVFYCFIVVNGKLIQI